MPSPWRRQNGERRGRRERGRWKETYCAITSLPDTIGLIARCWIADGRSKPKLALRKRNIENNSCRVYVSNRAEQEGRPRDDTWKISISSLIKIYRMLCASKTRALEYGRAKNENRCRVVSNSVFFFPTPVEMSLLPLYCEGYNN